MRTHLFASDPHMLSVANSVLTWRSLAEAVAARSKLNNAMCGEAKGNNLLVLSLSSRKCFMIVHDRRSIVHLNPNLCLCEVVVDDTARPFLDFDGDVGNNLAAISSAIREYLVNLCASVDPGKIRVHWKYSQELNGSCRRWHCVVAGISFRRCWSYMCAGLAEHINSTFSDVPVDMGIYRANSSLRMPLQNKLKEGRYTRRLHMYGPCIVDDLLVTSIASDTQVDAANTSSTGANTSNNGETTMPLLTTSAAIAGTVADTMPQFQLPYGLKVDKVIGNNCACVVIRLARYCASMCVICSRVHASDNAYIVVRSNTVEYRCYRRKLDEIGNVARIMFRR